MLGYFGGHFERRPIFRISRNLKILQMMSLPTDSAYKTGILTRKKYFNLTLMSKIWPKKVIFTYFRTFWWPF